MTNDELINIYKQALKDWSALQENFNSIEYKSIDSIKRVFADQYEEQGLFFVIRQGSVEAYVSSDTLKEPFTIKYKDYIQPYVTVEDIKKRIELLS